MYITSGITGSTSSDQNTGYPCTKYHLSYSLDDNSIPIQSRIALRSEDISCDLTQSAKFWTITYPLPSTTPDYITWSFGPDTLSSSNNSDGGMWLRVEVADQEGQYAMSAPFYALPLSQSQEQYMDCYDLAEITPVYHLPLSKQSSEDFQNNTAAWDTCVPLENLNLNDRDYVDNPSINTGSSSSSSSSSSSWSAGHWFLAVGLPLIIVALIATILGGIWWKRRQLKHRTANVATPAVNNALQKKLSSSPTKSEFPDVPLPMSTFATKAEA